MEYGIAAAPTMHQLQQLVNQMIQKGWVPQGGISAVPRASYLRDETYHDIRAEYLQAVTRQAGYQLPNPPESTAPAMNG